MDALDIKESTMVKRVEWDKGTLKVIFKRGDRVYVYKGIPRDLFDDLKRAPSKGKFVMQYIIGRYDIDKQYVVEI